MCHKYLCQKLLKFVNFFPATIDNIEDIFSRFVYLTHILLRLLFLSNAEADIGWGGKLNVYSMASCVKNIHTKNYYDRMIFLQVTMENVRDIHWDTV